MFDKIQHIGYLTADLDGAVAWFKKSFGGERVGGGNMRGNEAVPSGGRNTFIHFGQVEVELIEPADPSAEGLAKDTLVMHHVGYVVADIHRASIQLQARGFQFAVKARGTNSLGQQVLYFDPVSTNGVLMHLTQLPVIPNTVGVGQGLGVSQIVHAGYLVDNVDHAVAWYKKSFDGAVVGGIGTSRTGARQAFVNFGQVQVELIEMPPPPPAGREATDPKNRGRKPCVMDHVGYVVPDIHAGIADAKRRGLRFAGPEAVTNRIGQQLLYLDTATSMGSRMHLTQIPD
jgi:catechol 2,3-dioxygenase-like lactoylglutathione lyase family enzyme